MKAKLKLYKYKPFLCLFSSSVTVDGDFSLQTCSLLLYFSIFSVVSLEQQTQTAVVGDTVCYASIVTHFSKIYTTVGGHLL
ncbi:hypothetical protein EB796_023356 [Bugula neritina]|uniref:Uncharacterized protein n=1 Tax=Bugula neritina TaxID=10212 RepID=A0A7J7IWP3_BUGNE|nr:hypothetical protein EB796_023356 [Bugula neritina]